MIFSFEHLLPSVERYQGSLEVALFSKRVDEIIHLEKFPIVQLVSCW